MDTLADVIQQEATRIECLPEADLVMEVQHAMNGRKYPWDPIYLYLQQNEGASDPYSADLRCLCLLRTTWRRYPQLSQSFNASVLLPQLRKTPF